MLLLVQNRILTKDRERTWLTASVSPGGTTLTVKAIDSVAWANNDWIFVGEIGTPNAEVLQINGVVTDGTSLTIDNAGSGGARFAHSVDEPVYRVDYNQAKFYRGTTTDGSAATLLATVELQPDDYETRYDDQVNTTGYGFVRFFNSQTSGVSPFSDAIPYDGQSARSLAKMMSKVRTLCDEKSDDFLSDDEIVDAINDKQRDILNERLWTFNEIERSTSSVQYQFDYDKSSDIKTIHTVRYQTWPMRNIAQAKWEMLRWNTSQNTTNPTHVAVFEGKVRFWPTPSAGAATTQLNGAITSTATSIVVDDATDFHIGDYYRFIIDSEVIYATYANTSTNTFTGCLRGQEGTTAASHLDNATVTERDIVQTGQAEPVDLEGLNDETIIPEALVICYGVSADFCLGKLQKETLGDRYEARYKTAIDNLRDKFSLKLTSQYGRVKNPQEIVSDNSYFPDPNDYPTNVQAS